MPTLLARRANQCVDESLGFVVPQVMQPMAEWLREHWRDREGNRFNEVQVPWITAPQGPCDAIDNPQYNELWFQWAARTFKTTFGQAMFSRRAHQAPCQMMFATRNENLCKRVFRRYWQQLDKMPCFRDAIPVERLRNATTIDWVHNSANVIGTWAGSKSGLADESIPCGHAGEVDKWTQESTSTEGDPLPRFLKRGGEWPDRKFLIETTPSEREHSRIERGRLMGTNHKYHVPCPHCYKFQEIVFGDGKEPPGIFWERKGPRGKSDLILAAKTAHYVCAYCHDKIEDTDRFWMSNHGVWVPEGCEVDHDKAMRAREYQQFSRKWLIGEPVRDGNIYSSQLSVFHALFHGYGDMAVDFLKKHDKEDERRQWKNEEAAETWTRGPKEQAWRDLYDRLHDAETPGGIIPTWASLVTMAVDRQKDFFVFMVVAWGPGRQCHVVAYGESERLEPLRDELMLQHFEHADGGGSLPVSFTLIDNGYRPDGAVEDFCIECVQKHRIQVWTCEGSESKLQSDYEVRRKGDKSAKRGLLYYFVDSGRTQMWMEDVLHSRTFGNEGSGSIHQGDPEQHQDLLEQLLNERETTVQTRTGHDRVSWNRISRDVPNDFRDCWRYNYVAMQVATRNRAIKPRNEKSENKQKSAIISSAMPTGGARW